MTQEEKQQAHEILIEYAGGMLNQLASIDIRLAEYFGGMIANPELHNGYEILGAVKFLRLLNTYEYNTERVQQVIRLREGEWEKDEKGRWRHLRGGNANSRMDSTPNTYSATSVMRVVMEVLMVRLKVCFTDAPTISARES